MSKKVLTVILDGWGMYKDYPGNAISLGKTPTWDRLWKKYPHATISASGEDIGLPHGQMGTSEVNHMILGAGKVMNQDLLRINKSIDDGSFFKNEVFIKAIDHAKKNDSALHILGLLSDGGVHSHQHHIFSLLKIAKEKNFKRVYLHMFTDGRDTLIHSSLTYLSDLKKVINELGVGKIKSIVGRYYPMDRDTNWDRIQVGLDLLIKAKGAEYDDSIRAIESSHKKDVTDEFIKPIWIGDKHRGTIKDNDSIIFANFRIDRTRQLTRKILQHGFDNLHFVTMTQYHPDFNVSVAFPTIDVENPLGKIISDAGMKQLRVTETEKFAHLTFFLNCKFEDPFAGEDRVMIDTYSDIATHDERPEMRAPDITNEIIHTMESSSHEAIFANICNGDIVGHTGNIKAAIEAVETVDVALDQIIKVAKKHDYHVIITADHGNCEEMISEQSGEILTSHTTNPVPFVLVSNKYKKINREEGNLTDITATILKMLNIQPDNSMTGESFV